MCVCVREGERERERGRECEREFTSSDFPRLRESSKFDTILYHFLLVYVCVCLSSFYVFTCAYVCVCVCVSVCMSDIAIVSFENEIFFVIKENRLRPS